MRKLIMILTLFLFGQVLSAQSIFCPDGAQWFYYSLGSNRPSYQIHIVYEADTTINGFNDVKILRKEFRSDWSPFGWFEYHENRMFSRQSHDSIFKFINGEFKLMYDFNVEEGDERVVFIGGDDICSTTDTMHIDSIRFTNYQGQSLKTYYFRLLVDDQLSALNGYYQGGGNGVYMERIGLMTDHPVDIRAFCWPSNLVSEYMPANFVCYTDNHQTAAYPDTCNLFLGVDDELVQGKPILIYFQETLQIQNAQNSTFYVYDILGNELFRTTVNSINQTIDLNGFPNGILLIVCENKEFRVTKKVVRFSN